MRSLQNGTALGPVTAKSLLIQHAIFWIASIAIAVALLLTTMGGLVYAQNGKQDYDHYCADCHGINGDGKGTTKLISPQYPPPDLTHLAQRNGGKFPFDRVVSIVDGRQSIPSHARIEMPFWGVTMQEPGKEFTPKSNAQVKARIDAIVKYIETLQVK